MRFSTLALSLAWALGVTAIPLDKRALLTKVDWIYVTKTVWITEGAAIATKEAQGGRPRPHHPHGRPHPWFSISTHPWFGISTATRVQYTLPSEVPAHSSSETSVATPISETETPVEAPSISTENRVTPSSTEAPALPPSTEVPEPPSYTEAPDPPPSSEVPAPPTSTESPAPPGSTETPAPPPSTETPAPPTSTEAPAPPTSTEAPAPPPSTEAPALPTSTEAPAPPTSTEAPAPPTSTEAPAPPPSTEDPAPPSSTEAPAPPPSTEAPASPSPTEAPVPPSPTEAPAASSPTPSASKEGSSRVTGYAQATLSSGPAYETMVIYHHNAARALHGAEPLVWNNDLAAKSLDWANNCQFKHNSAGQNLFATSGDAFNVSAGIINSWYNAEIVHMDGYWGAPNIPEPAFSSVGHFTQMVWKSTKSIGCASVDCSGRMVDENGNPIQYSKYTVCDYDPAGNVVGQYAENIVRPSTATVLNWAA